MKLIDKIRELDASNLIMRKLLALGFTYEDEEETILLIHPNGIMKYCVQSRNALMMFYYGYLAASDPTLVIKPVDSF